jgi:hypothetical protein
MGNVHIGKRIKEVFEKSHLSVVEFASKINRTRDVAYKIFAKDHIDTELLQKISQVLSHDFFNYYSANFSGVKEIDNAYGYATKDEVRSLAETVQALAKEIQKLRPKPRTKKIKR